MTQVSRDNALPSLVASAVRGPGGLQADIADEIADHLACHVDEHAGDDPAAAEAEAVRAFGDANQIARELRAVHMGEWIMFQRLMVVALVVIVVGMALSAYFSWSATRSLTAQLAQTSSETQRQFAEVSKLLASMTKLQQAAAPPKLKIYCHMGTPEQPAPDYKLTVMSIDPKGGRGQLFCNTYRTNAAGWVETGPLSPGRFELSGMWLVAQSPGVPGAKWTRLVQLRGDNATEEIRVRVGSGLRHTIRVVVPPEVTWNPKGMSSVGLRFDRSEGPQIAKIYQETWCSWIQQIRLTGDTMDGLSPGPATATLLLPYGGAESQDSRFHYLTASSVSAGKVEIPEDGGTITVTLPKPDGNQVTGLLYDGSKDKPVAGARIDVLYPSRWARGPRPPFNPSAVHAMESLLTDAKGRFGAMQDGRRSTIVLRWRAADGAPATLIREVTSGNDRSPHVEIDVAKLRTARIVVTGMDKLHAEGYELAEPIEIRWQRQSRRNEMPRSLSAHGVLHLRANWKQKENALTTLMFAEDYRLHVQVHFIEPITFQRTSRRARKPYGLTLGLGSKQQQEVRIALEEVVKGSPGSVARGKVVTPPESTPPRAGRGSTRTTAKKTSSTRPSSH